MYAVKANRQYSIEKKDTAAYQAQGYDIVDDSGKVLRYGAGKTFSAADYEHVCTERDEALAKVAGAEAERDEALAKVAGAEAERDEALKAVDAFRAEIKKLKKE